MDNNEEVQPEQIEDYCRQLGLQLRDEHEMSVNDASRMSFLGTAVEGQNPNENGQPIAPGHASLEGKEKTNFECKKCDKNFANSRQFLKHKCVLKTEEERQTKPKGKKRGRKPRVKKGETTTTTEGISGEVTTEKNTNTSKVESEPLVEEQLDHLSDHTYIKDEEESLNQTEDTPGGKNIQCDSCQLLAEIDPDTENNPNKIPCEKCQELSTSAMPAVKSTDDNESIEENTKKRKYSFKTEKQNCPHCEKGFHSQKRFEKHIPVCKMNLVCPFCKKDFSTNGRMAYAQYQAHYYTHVETKPFTCLICSRGFIRKADLDRHKIIHIDNYSPQRCPQCGAVFASAENLAKHMHKHDRLPLSCKKCGQQFARQATLDKHVEVCQTETSCEICGKVFKCLSKNIKSRYQEHMFIHTGEKPYKCQFCERGFRDRSTRRKHERTHTGERPYPCTVCDRAFSQLRLLRNHVRTHTGEKPYSCHLCTLSFAKSCNLKYHMRVHTKEKPYSCSICFKSFTQSGTYHKHMRRHQEAGSLAPTMINTQAHKPVGEPSQLPELASEVDVINTPQREVIENALVHDSNPITTSAENFASETVGIVVNTDSASAVHDTQVCGKETQVISTDGNSQQSNDAASTIPEMPPMSGDEITIIVSEGDGVTAEVATTLATIDVDQISSILASCS